jgi:hypothetical protein
MCDHDRWPGVGAGRRDTLGRASSNADHLGFQSSIGKIIVARERSREVMVESFAESVESLMSMGPGAIDRFAASVPSEWIEECLIATESASIRRRKLPAEQVVWLVVGMGLYEDRSICAVVEHLGLTLPGVTSLAPSAVAKARSALGAAPIEWLFRRVAEEWANRGGTASYRGLTPYAIDGTTLRVQDTDANFAHFGKPTGRNGTKNDAGYPQSRLECLLNLSTRLIVDARFGPYATSEQELATPLWSSIPDNSITILDRGFINYPHFVNFANPERKRHLLVRLRENIKPEVIEVLSDGSCLARMVPTAERIKEDPNIPRELVGRIVSYEHEGGKPSRLFTTLTDPKAYPADELIALYHDRWEIELAFDEVKTHLRDRAECLRSKTVAGVEQEIWGLLLTYNLVRREMLLVARANKLAPNRISFVAALLWIRDFWASTCRTSPGNIPKYLGTLQTKLKQLFLPPRRSERRYPRHVKITLSGYKRNRGRRPTQSLK